MTTWTPNLTTNLDFSSYYNETGSLPFLSTPQHLTVYSLGYTSSCTLCTFPLNATVFIAARTWCLWFLNCYYAEVFPFLFFA
jgi:hypothetical protein